MRTGWLAGLSAERSVLRDRKNDGAGDYARSSIGVCELHALRLSHPPLSREEDKFKADPVLLCSDPRTGGNKSIQNASTAFRVFPLYTFL